MAKKFKQQVREPQAHTYKLIWNEKLQKYITVFTSAQDRKLLNEAAELSYYVREALKAISSLEENQQSDYATELLQTCYDAAVRANKISAITGVEIDLWHLL